MQNEMNKGLPCGKLKMFVSKVMVTYVRSSGSIKVTRLPESAKAHSSRRLCAISRKSCGGGFTEHRDIQNLMLLKRTSL